MTENASVTRAEKIKHRGVGLVTVLISLNCFAGENWNVREAHMQCGPAIVSVNAECKADPEDNDFNICRNISLKISQEKNVFTAKLPYMPIEQKKKLENQKFIFADVVDVTDWAPQKMYCIDDKYVLVGYWDGMNDAETIDGSLTFNTFAPIFDFSGGFVNDRDSILLRKQVISVPSGSVDINFVYGGE